MNSGEAHQLKTQKAKTFKKNLLAFAIGCVLAVVGAEVLLRLTTSNIYSQMSLTVGEISRGIRLNWPMVNTLYANGLYEGAGKVMFRVDEKRNIYPGFENTGEEQILFLGGSTTESPMVDEGVRFPDLIGQSLNCYPMNYGRSGNSSLESYINLEYVLHELGLKPKIVFLLHGWNDFGVFLKSGSPMAISDIETLLDMRNGSGNQEFAKQRINSYIRKSYLVAHLYIALKGIFGDSYLENLVKDAREQGRVMASDEEFREFIQSVQFKLFLENRKGTYKKFIDTAKEHGAKVVLFTQPASYSDSYKSYSGKEVRIFPKTLDGKRMTIVQARKLQDLISQNTREAAEEGNALLIDLDKYFSEVDVSPLIYDALHYSEKGSRLIAELTIREIRKNAFIEDDRWLQ